jgi:hypothetical protein
MITAKTAILGTFATVGLAAALAGCQTHQYPTAWEGSTFEHAHPYQNWWSYQFVYYPGQQVYFEPYTETYFWFENGLWEQGPELGENFAIDSSDAVVVKLQHKKPYVQHCSVTVWHPNYYGPVPGSLDPYHATPEAIAMSEERAAIRLASALDQIQQMESELGDMSGLATPDPGAPGADATWQTPGGLASAEESTTSSSQPESISGVDTQSDDHQP